jgi:hypothetical protein
MISDFGCVISDLFTLNVGFWNCDFGFNYFYMRQF